MGPGAEKLSSQAEQLRRQQGLLRALKMRQLKRKVTAAAERSPPPSSPELSSDGDDSGDKLPEYLVRLGVWELEEKEDELSGLLRQLSLGAARRQQPAAAPESDEEPAEPALFIGLIDFSGEQPGSKTHRLFQQLNKAFSVSECRSSLEESGGDLFQAHWWVRQRMATLLAISLPPDKRQYDAHVNACWNNRCSEEEQQLAPLARKERALKQHQAAAKRGGDSAAQRQAREQLAQLQQRRFSIHHDTSYATLQRINQWSMSVETVDVHAQRVPDAGRIVADVVWHNTHHWPPYRHGRHMVVFITGRGKHSGEQGSQLRPEVEQELQQHGIPFRQDRHAVCAFFYPPAAA